MKPLFGSRLGLTVENLLEGKTHSGEAIIERARRARTDSYALAEIDDLVLR
jgi:hypothetical protein